MRPHSTRLGSSGRSSAASRREPAPERRADLRNEDEARPAEVLAAISPENPDLRRRESEMRASDH